MNFRKTIIFTIFLLNLETFLANVLKAETDKTAYDAARTAIIAEESQQIIGGRLPLDGKESRVNQVLMQYKIAELEKGTTNGEVNTPAMHFFRAKELIERSVVYKFLQQMPKGGLLHTHAVATVSAKWVVQTLSYMPGLLRCTNRLGDSVLSFRKLPQQHDCQTDYINIGDERANARSAAIYDEYFEKLINLYTPSPEVDYPTINKVWTRFANMFGSTYDMLSYVPAFRAYHLQMLKEMYEDRIMYAEVRSNFKQLYELNGTVYPHDYAVRVLLNVIDEFRREYPKFLGIKIIYTTYRKVDSSKMRQQMELFKQLHTAYPNFIVGFDLVGQEDLGNPLYNFIDIFQELPKSANYFFHAGETNSYSQAADMNIIDALLLNTKRIGHGFALVKHPTLLNEVQKRDIAVEVSPISNQVLKLVTDLRNHPGSILISRNVPMVVCNDDPGFWNAKGLSYDFYYVFMSMAPNNAGLGTLKALVWNSIRYALLSEAERKLAYAALETDWTRFIDMVLQGKVI